ncbi:MAG: AAA family ATPase, partial [Phycisphaerae bacterium]|nr:AAA family ATPase [Phycisphaerae bacterium]
MIRRITLDNFMSHAHTVIELDAGLNALIGPNNCGKSAVVEALRAVCDNTRGTEYVIRHGAKEATVMIETDDEHIVIWRRRKNS